jgi:AcrR family transcriptional regulator
MATRELTPKGARTRARIVQTAAQLMSERGVANTTVEDVREAAGVSASQVYHYFTDKRDLVQAVIDHQTESVVGSQAPLFVDLDTLEGLRTWRDALVAIQHERQCRGGCPLGTLGAELAEIDDGARRSVADGMLQWEDGIRGGLRAMHAAGRLRAEADPDALATATLAALQGGLLLTQLERDTRPLEVALDAMLELIAAQQA